ncbi:hypothetical protein QOZ80_9BG0716790 [Eleusine coracana subsp. coracana]|nr:hypothetical protein QOZ80_9BG0716790 [Eleusine coracana subsp. coracana]
MMKPACASGGTSLVASEPDRLSALPDCLLHTIMSFLKARQVVQTCVLSTRWRHLWCSVPCLDIDIDEFNTGSGLSYLGVPHNDKNWEDFEDFAVNLMLHSNIALMDSFRLNIRCTKGPIFGSQLAASWLRRAMKYRGPSHSIQLAESSNSWRLKKMYLCNIFLDDRFAKHVSSVCHSLEHLELTDCTCQLYAITSYSLKNFVLKNCCCIKLSEIMSVTLKSLVIDGGSNSYDDYLVITAPSVANLHLAVDVVCFHAGISLNEMPCLDKASILLLGNRERGMESKLGRDQFKLLCSLSTVVSLELSNLMTMVFSEECTTTCKQFKNLRNLLLENCDVSDDFQTMALFLETSPHLEKLTLRHCTISNGTKKWISSQCRSLNVLRANLKLTKIIYKDDVCQLVQHFVHNSENLPNNQFEFRKVD